MGKLATVFYGTLGIPLLFYTIARTGNQLAESAANSLLILRHYCISLPLHYLCCSCFNPYQCLRLISWLCCCCCCSYLCCKPNRDKRKCCDTSRAPKLKLVNFGRRKQLQGHRQYGQFPVVGAGSGSGNRNQHQAAYVIAGSGQLANGGLQTIEQVTRDGKLGVVMLLEQAIDLSNASYQKSI